MRIGIGLPNTVPGAAGSVMIEWACRAEGYGFTTLATIDRIAYPNYESLTVLAAAGAVTERIGLLTNVLLGPTRNPVLLAKQAASVDQLSNGRLTLGVGVGTRPDDYVAAEQDFHTRGERWNAALELMHKAWRGEPVAGSAKPVTPRPVSGDRVPLLIGGTSDATLKRVVRWGVGWTAGGAGPDMAGAFAVRVRQAWNEAGREGKPRIVALAYYALGVDAAARGAAYIRDYYGSAPWVAQMVQSLPHTTQALRELARRYVDAGIDELILDPTIAEIDQIDMLAEALGADGESVRFGP